MSRAEQSGSRLSWVLLAVMTFAGACTDDPGLVTPTSSMASTSTSRGVPSPEYLPYGVHVPAEENLRGRLPEPYKPLRHGPPLANTSSNIAAMLPRVRREFPSPAPGPSASFQHHDVHGFVFPTNIYSPVNGIFLSSIVNQQVIPLSGTQVIYAPAGKPKYGCLETVTTHYGPAYGNIHAQVFWDHCVTNGIVYAENMAAPDFALKYLRPDGTNYRLWTKVVPTTMNIQNTCWNGYLYNFWAGLWELKAANICGVADLPNGWTFWEDYDLAGFTCPTIPSTGALPRILWDLENGTDEVWENLYEAWTLLFTTYCFTQGPYEFVYPNGGVITFWEAHTPNPPGTP